MRLSASPSSSFLLFFPPEQPSHLFSEVFFCQKDSPLYGLAQTLDDDLLFWFDFPASRWGPRLPALQPAVQNRTAERQIMARKKICDVVLPFLTDFSDKYIQIQIPEARGEGAKPRPEGGDGGTTPRLTWPTTTLGQMLRPHLHHQEDWGSHAPSPGAEARLQNRTPSSIGPKDSGGRGWALQPPQEREAGPLRLEWAAPGAPLTKKQAGHKGQEQAGTSFPSVTTEQLPQFLCLRRCPGWTLASHQLSKHSRKATQGQPAMSGNQPHILGGWSGWSVPSLARHVV